MKWSVLKAIFAAAIVCCQVLSSFSQSYYLVIGSFKSDDKNVREFTSYLPGVNHDTTYSVGGGKGGQFYVIKTSDKDFAMASSKIVEDHLSGSVPTQSSVESPLVLASASSAGANDMIASGLTNAPVAPKGKFFKFAVESYDGRKFNEHVHVVDLEKRRDLHSYPSDLYVDILRPQGKKPMVVAMGIFGYKEIYKEIDFYNPSETEGSYRDERGAWVIPYTLERVTAGDVSVMYNVGFHKDAVIMLPNSKKDLDELVAMMNENPGYVIKIHSHCNGKNRRKIIGLGETKNYFDVNGSVHIEGTAKELTNFRAEAITSYLLDHGIDPKRIKKYAWGGSDMLVDENDPQAKLNDRIEIEFLKD